MWNPIRPPATERSVEPILGWRAWRVHRTDDGPRLAPTTPRADWPPREAVRARCTGAHTRMYLVFNPELERFHRSPEPGCTCGIHAMKDPRRLSRGAHHAGVIGRVALWGRVIEHTRGWRAELAYPSQLRLICVRCLRGRRFPGTASVVAGDGEWPHPLCDAHATTATGGSVVDARTVEGELLGRYGVEVLPVEALEIGARGAA